MCTVAMVCFILNDSGHWGIACLQQSLNLLSIVDIQFYLQMIEFLKMVDATINGPFSYVFPIRKSGQSYS